MTEFACWSSSQNSLKEFLVNFSNLFLHFSVTDSFAELWVWSLHKDIILILGFLSDQFLFLLLACFVTSLQQMFSRGYYSSYYYLCWWNYLFLILEGGPVIWIICMIYLSFFQDVYKGAYVNSLLLRTGTLWNSLAVKCFLLTCDLNSFKDRFKKHFSCTGSF